jgi:hypothetical protein
MTTDLPTSQCPFCGYEMDRATHPEDNSIKPSPGDLSICLKCTSILRFDDGMRLAALEPEEFSRLPQEQQDYLHHMQRVGRSLDRTSM